MSRYGTPAEWSVFSESAPALASFGQRRLEAGPAYLATTRLDGSPRVHPTSPSVRAGHLVLYMFPTSPKAADLRRDPRYALHCSVDDRAGGGGEFSIRGSARLVDGGTLADDLEKAGFAALDGYIRFELLITDVFAGRYSDGSNVPTVERWKS